MRSPALDMKTADITWYGRAAVWIGVALLLLMAVAGHQVAIVTVLAVLAVIAGIVLLIYAIPFRGHAVLVDDGEPERRESG